VQIIELPAPTPTPGPPPGAWRSLTDPNQMNDLVVIGNTVWIAGSGGALAWTRGSSKPVLYTAADGLAGNQLNAVADCALPTFGVVFGGPSGLQIGDPRSGRWRQIAASRGGLRYNDIVSLYCDADNGFLIVGFAEHGIAIYDAAADEWRHLDRNSGLAANNARRIAVVGDRQQIWVASDEGVTVAAGADSTYYDSSNSPLTADRVTALAADADGAVWLGGQGALYRVADEEWTVYTADEVDGDFPTGWITGLALAPDGSLWLGSSDAAVCRFDPAQERCADYFAGETGMASGPLTNLTVSPAAASVRAADNAGADAADAAAYSVYYTTAGSGYAVYDGRAWRTLAVRQSPLLGNRVKALAPAADGSLWVATEAGVQQLAPAAVAAVGASDEADAEDMQPPLLFDAANSGISPLGVQTLYGAAADGVWVGGRQGAAFYDGDAWQSLSSADGLAGDNVQAITVDGDGRTWLGGDRGVSIWNGSSFFVIDSRQGLPAEDIRALAADGDGVWIGAAGGGLYRFEGNQLQLLNARNVGLPSDTITALAVDDGGPDGANGALWIGTDRGLARLADGAVTVIEDAGEDAISAVAVTASGAVWAARAAGGVVYSDGASWRELGVGDGLPAARITALAAVGDQIWLGGQDGGISVFTPAP
jgi:ligand-binding sensor domain-containing protein